MSDNVVPFLPPHRQGIDTGPSALDLDRVSLAEVAGWAEFIHPITGETHIAITWINAGEKPPEPGSPQFALAFGTDRMAEGVAHGLLEFVAAHRAAQGS